MGLFGRKLGAVNLQQPTTGQYDPNDFGGNFPQFSGNAPKKGGFFAQGGTGRNIAGFIGDALQQMSGGEATFAPFMQRQREQDAEIQARLQAALAKQKADRDDHIWKSEYDRANPKASEFELNLAAAGITGEEAVRLRKEKAQNAANPPQWRQDPSTGAWMRIDNNLGSPVPDAQFGGWGEEGGQTPTASGNFRP
jgi:hypothetical protein